MLRLLIEDSEGKSKQAQISPESADITIGRKAGNVIRLKERNVSREHARIYQNDEGLFVAPVAARYGMKVNGKKIDGPTHIELGDEIRIGDYRLYVQDESKPTLTHAEETAQAFEKGEAIALPHEQQPRLVVVSSNFAGREYPITSTRCSIGRATDNDVCFNHSSVSSKHAEIYRNGRGNFEIRNLSSSNGTKVNGMDISSGPHELQSGEFITFGLVTTRFCAPGDLWFLNLGATVEQKSPSKLVYVLAGAVLLLMILLTVFVTMQFSGQNDAPVQPAAPAAQDNSTLQAVELMGLVMDCQNEIDNGDFDAAQAKCNEAAKINNADTRLIHAQDKLRKEMIAMDDFKKIQDDIASGECRAALNAIKDLDKDTYAYKQLQLKDSSSQSTVERAQECLEDSLYERARNSLDANDIRDAQAALDEIRSKGRPNAPIIARLEADIKAKKGERTKRDSPSKPRDDSKQNSQQPAAPADAGSGMSIDDMCAIVVRAKITKDYKKACEYAKKAQKKGGNDACKGKVSEYVSSYCK